MSVSRRKTELLRKLKKLQDSLVDGPAGKHLRAWCEKKISERKNWLLVTLTQTVVRAAEGLYVLEEIIRNGMTGWLQPLPPVEDWERMYRRSNRTILKAFDCICTVPHEMRELLDIPDEVGDVGCGTAVRVAQIGIRQLKREDQEEINRLAKEFLTTPEARKVAQAAQVFIRQTYDDLLSKPIATDADDATVDEWLRQPDVQFLFLVCLPCWLEYGESASQLLERAESGDISALERLVRLDKRAFYFPRIRRLVDESIRNRIEGSFALTADAFAGIPKPQLKLDRLQIALATFVLYRSRDISAIHAKLFGPPLTKRDLFEAFNAGARDRGLKRDVMLPYDEDSFGKRIDREKRFRTAGPWDIISA